MTNRTFDRLPQFDERSRSFSIAPLLETRTVRSRGWSLRTYLDQGAEGACVGFAWAHELAAIPRKVTVSDEHARNIYRRAQQLDIWPGEAYSGTSVLAGAKAVQEQGHLTEYRWAFGLTDTLLALGYHGPVVFGLNWHRGMMATDPKGYIHPTGELMGGHAIVGIAVHAATKRIVLQNSWGPNWGNKGRCYLGWDDLDRLLKDDGECCIPVQRSG